MTTENLVYPDVAASLRLINEITEYFAHFSFVNRIFIFGSFAEGTQDRWSDVDMLVITSGGSSQHWQIFASLQRQKPILHHHIFTPRVEPAGGNVLGIVFEDESVFHNLDLNFMSQTEFLLPNALDRFGTVKELYASNHSDLTDSKGTFPLPGKINPAEKRIGLGIHWTKKAVKKVLRGSQNLDDLVKTSAQLKEIMRDYPEDTPVLAGNICRLAHTYIEIADQLILRQQDTRYQHFLKKDAD